MASKGSISEKVKRILQQFDTNRDGGLNRKEMTSLVVDFDYGAGDIDHDFDALRLEFKLDDTNEISLASEALSSSITDESVAEFQKKQRTAVWAASPPLNT